MAVCLVARFLLLDHHHRCVRGRACGDVKFEAWTPGLACRAFSPPGSLFNLSRADAAASRSGFFPPPFRCIVTVSGIFSSSSLGSSPYRPSPFYLASKLTEARPPAPKVLPFPFSTRIPDAIPHLITPLTDTPPLDIREWDAAFVDTRCQYLPPSSPSHRHVPFKVFPSQTDIPPPPIPTAFIARLPSSINRASS
ncbi:hypothetical protein NMY22_g3436 [Coprinellus aureogranulatus]|nr:hypothetical protein NMY22_g3436 [Coprinellus aureogranulatus]